MQTFASDVCDISLSTQVNDLNLFDDKKNAIIDRSKFTYTYYESCNKEKRFIIIATLSIG